METAGLERRQSSRHLIHDTSERPNVRLEAVDALVVEELWRHVIRRAIFALGAILLPLSLIIVVLALLAEVR